MSILFVSLWSKPISRRWCVWIGDVDGDTKYLSAQRPPGFVTLHFIPCSVLFEWMHCVVFMLRNGAPDTGGSSSSAIEMRHKMKSRQSCYEAIGAGEVAEDFTICSQINQHSIDWALRNAPKRTISRYEQFGEELRVGPDQYSKTGTHWTYSPLNETRMCGADGRYFTAVQSSYLYLKTLSKGCKFKPSSECGVHYCKVLRLQCLEMLDMLKSH